MVRAASRAALVHPELRNKPARLPLAADVLGWSPDPSFRPSKQVQVVELDDAADDATLARAVAHVWSRALPADRPPWELTAFSDRSGGRTTILVKAHHSLADALGTAGLAATLLGTPPDAVPAPIPRVPRRRVRAGMVPSLLNAAAAIADEGARRSRALAAEVRDMIRPGVALARTREVGRILESAGTLLSSPAPETPWNGALGSERRVAWLALSRDVLRGIEDAFGGGWEDAWLTIVADALGRNLRGRGRATTGLTLLAYVPGEEHGQGAAVLSSAAAHATARLVGLPVDEMSPAARHAAITRGRAEPLAAARGSGLEQLARMSHRLPAPLQTLLGSLCYQAANTVPARRARACRAAAPGRPARDHDRAAGGSAVARGPRDRRARVARRGGGGRRHGGRGAGTAARRRRPRAARRVRRGRRGGRRAAGRSAAPRALELTATRAGRGRPAAAAPYLRRFARGDSTAASFSSTFRRRAARHSSSAGVRSRKAR